MSELLKLIKVNDVSAGEAKVLLDFHAKVYPIGVDVSVSVWTKIYTLSLGAALFKV